MRWILIVLLMLTAGVVHARILHVGDNTIKLSQTKTTTPALHVRVGDEVWYGNMTTHSSTQKLHIKYNDKTYTVCNGEKLKNGNYDFAGDCLIGANENVYLESTGTQWIETGLYGNQDSSAKVSVQVYDNGSYRSLIFGSRRSYASSAFFFNGGYNDGRHWFLIMVEQLTRNQHPI